MQLTMNLMMVQVLQRLLYSCADMTPDAWKASDEALPSARYYLALVIGLTISQMPGTRRFTDRSQDEATADFYGQHQCNATITSMLGSQITTIKACDQLGRRCLEYMEHTQSHVTTCALPPRRFVLGDYKHGSPSWYG